MLAPMFNAVSALVHLVAVLVVGAIGSPRMGRGRALWWVAVAVQVVTQLGTIGMAFLWSFLLSEMPEDAAGAVTLGWSVTAGLGLAVSFGLAVWAVVTGHRAAGAVTAR